MYSTYHSPAEGDRVGSLSQRQEQGKRTVGFLSWVTSPVIKSHREKHLHFLVSKVERSNFALHCMLNFISTKFTVGIHSCQTAATTKLLPFLSLFKLCKKLFLTWRETGAGLWGAVAGRRGVQLIVPGHWYRALKCFFFYDKNFKICTNKKTVVILNTHTLSGYTWEMSFSVW